MARRAFQNATAPLDGSHRAKLPRRIHALIRQLSNLTHRLFPSTHTSSSKKPPRISAPVHVLSTAPLEPCPLPRPTSPPHYSSHHFSKGKWKPLPKLPLSLPAFRASDSDSGSSSSFGCSGDRRLQLAHLRRDVIGYEIPPDDPTPTTSGAVAAAGKPELVAVGLDGRILSQYAEIVFGGGREGSGVVERNSGCGDGWSEWRPDPDVVCVPRIGVDELCYACRERMSRDRHTGLCNRCSPLTYPASPWKNNGHRGGERGGGECKSPDTDADTPKVSRFSMSTVSSPELSPDTYVSDELEREMERESVLFDPNRFTVSDYLYDRLDGYVGQPTQPARRRSVSAKSRRRSTRVSVFGGLRAPWKKTGAEVRKEKDEVAENEEEEEEVVELLRPDVYVPPRPRPRPRSSRYSHVVYKATSFASPSSSSSTTTTTSSYEEVIELLKPDVYIPTPSTAADDGDKGKNNKEEKGEEPRTSTESERYYRAFPERRRIRQAWSGRDDVGYSYAPVQGRDATSWLGEQYRRALPKRGTRFWSRY